VEQSSKLLLPIQAVLRFILGLEAWCRNRDSRNFPQSLPANTETKTEKRLRFFTFTHKNTQTNKHTKTNKNTKQNTQKSKHTYISIRHS